MRRGADSHRDLTCPWGTLQPHSGAFSVRPSLSWLGGRAFRGLRFLSLSAEAPLAMIVTVIYAVAAIGIAIYMLMALVRPERF
jgi:hypothetical protein